MISHARLNELLSYDPETGIFVCLTARKASCPAGMRATCTNKKGYGRITLDRRSYQLHRLAWFYVHAEWPPRLIDHRDLNKTNNRIANLRVATNSQNTANQPLGNKNTSGFKGVVWHKSKWQAQITANGKTRYLGLFIDPAAAHAAYVAAAKEAFGEFARAA
jgi:hypothetical protein